MTVLLSSHADRTPQRQLLPARSTAAPNKTPPLLCSAQGIRTSGHPRDRKIGSVLLFFVDHHFRELHAVTVDATAPKVLEDASSTEAAAGTAISRANGTDDRNGERLQMGGAGRNRVARASRPRMGRQQSLILQILLSPLLRGSVIPIQPTGGLPSVDPRPKAHDPFGAEKPPDAACTTLNSSCCLLKSLLHLWDGNNSCNPWTKSLSLSLCRCLCRCFRRCCICRCRLQRNLSNLRNLRIGRCRFFRCLSLPLLSLFADSSQGGVEIGCQRADNILKRGAARRRNSVVAGDQLMRRIL